MTGRRTVLRDSFGVDKNATELSGGSRRQVNDYLLPSRGSVSVLPPRSNGSLLSTGPRDGLSLMTRAFLVVAGAVPVSLIGASTFGVLTLKQLTVFFLLPALVGLVVLTVTSSASWLLVKRAVVAGVTATFIYDIFRWTCLALGLMDGDPIPHIGTDLGLEPGWVFGYLWRFLGNGSGIAVAFYAFGGRGIVAGTAHGLVVASGLLAVLAISPHGQQALFPLTPTIVAIAVTGHVIYGVVLGLISKKMPSPAEPLTHLRPSFRLRSGA